MFLPNNFILRRLHSLSGVLPLGVFLLLHYYSLSKALGPNGIQAYGASLQDGRGIPFVVLLEIFFIYLPLLFHAFYGLILIPYGRGNATHYGYADNFRHSLQRMTGILAFVFVGYHLYVMRWLPYYMGESLDYIGIVTLFQTPWRVWFYGVGTTLLLFHFTNGLWNFFISWGITVSVAAQRLSLFIGMLLFVSLSVLNFLVIVNFTFHYHEAPQILAPLLEGTREYLFR